MALIFGKIANSRISVIGKYVAKVKYFANLFRGVVLFLMHSI